MMSESRYSSFGVNSSQGKVEAFKKVKGSFLIFKVGFRLVAQSFRILMLWSYVKDIYL